MQARLITGTGNLNPPSLVLPLAGRWPAESRLAWNSTVSQPNFPLSQLRNEALRGFRFEQFAWFGLALASLAVLAFSFLTSPA